MRFINNTNKTSIYLADCLNLLKEWYSKGRTAFIDLIYIDPPFNSKRNYNVLFDSDMAEEGFKDTWSNIAYLDEMEEVAALNPDLYNFLNMLDKTNIPKGHISYLTMMAIRCWYMRKMLKDTGSFYYHCDTTAGHYVKIMLDYIFGMGNFRNEIIWTYRTGGVSKRWFGKKHDLLFVYSKTKKYNFNLLEKKEYYKDIYGKDVKPRFPDRKQGQDENGYYRCVYMNDVWNIQAVFNMSKERLGYPTQKPEALLERIILASSNEGDLVADFFMGGGTTIAVAERLNRIAIGTDINYRAIQITQKRLTEKLERRVKKDFYIFGIPKSSAELRQMVADNILGTEKNSRFAFEDVIIKYYLTDVIGNEKKVGDNNINGKFVFTYNRKIITGLVQVTTGAGINHFKAFCSEIGKNNIGVYITFADKITSGMVRKAKQMGKIGQVDKLQILSVEDLIDNGKYFEIPNDLDVIFGR